MGRHRAVRRSARRLLPRSVPSVGRVNTAPLHTLAEGYRENAREMRRLGATVPADIWTEAARMFEERVRAWEEGPLTLRQAAEESGLSYSTLQQNVRAGLIPNAGRP